VAAAHLPSPPGRNWKPTRATQQSLHGALHGRYLPKEYFYRERSLRFKGSEDNPSLASGLSHNGQVIP
jgi:hypothetical protein